MRIKLKSGSLNVQTVHEKAIEQAIAFLNDKEGACQAFLTDYFRQNRKLFPKDLILRDIRIRPVDERDENFWFQYMTSSQDQSAWLAISRSAFYAMIDRIFGGNGTINPDDNIRNMTFLERAASEKPLYEIATCLSKGLSIRLAPMDSERAIALCPSTPLILCELFEQQSRTPLISTGFELRTIYDAACVEKEKTYQTAKTNTSGCETFPISINLEARLPGGKITFQELADLRIGSKVMLDGKLVDLEVFESQGISLFKADLDRSESGFTAIVQSVSQPLREN